MVKDLDEEDDEGGERMEGEGDAAEEMAAAAAAPSSKKSLIKKILLFVLLPILLLGGIGAGAYFTGALNPVFSMLGIGGGGGGEGGSSAAKSVDQAVFYDLPEMLVNLNTPGKKQNFLKIKVSLELDNPKDIPRIEQVMPRIVDNFQVYLRELRIDDLQGAAGLYRLREELLARVKTAARPARVNDVLFKEMLVQ